MSEETKPVHIDVDAAIKGLYAQANEKPGVYVRKDGYPGCVNIEYNSDGKKVPSCIVGSYLASIIGINDVPESGSARSTLAELKRRGLITYTPEAQFVLMSAQALQDTLKVEWITIASKMGDIAWYASRLVQELGGQPRDESF